MPKFTVQIAYPLEAFGHVVVEAATVEEACAKALEDPNFDDFKDDAEGSGETYVAGIVEGEFASLYAPAIRSGRVETLDVPDEFAQEGAVRRWLNLPGSPPEVRDLLLRFADAMEDAITTHIYDEDNGDVIPEDCSYTALVAEARKVAGAGVPDAQPQGSRIAVFISGGAVQDVTWDHPFPGKLIVVDYDVDGADADKLVQVDWGLKHHDLATVETHDLSVPAETPGVPDFHPVEDND